MQFNINQNKNDDKIRIKGVITFFATEKGIKYSVTDEQETKAIVDKAFKDDFEDLKESILDVLLSSKVKGYFVSGKDFLNRVLSGEYTNASGSVYAIYIDRCISNLGLFYRSKDGVYSTFGKFLVTPDVFEEFCKDHNVMIDWVETDNPIANLLDIRD